MAERALTYSSAGVDIATADRLNDCIRRLAKKTFNRNVLTGIGSFGAVYSLTGKKLKKPVLVSSADGVGTKLKIAFAMAKHDTVGQCLVNHCVNDIAVQGASPPVSWNSRLLNRYFKASVELVGAMDWR